MDPRVYWWGQSARRTHPRPAPVNQGPLPPFDTSGQPSLSWPIGQRTLPGAYDPKFWRGNAWTVVVPGLPWIPGITSSIHPERCLSWYLAHPTWAPFVDAVLTQQAQQGNTHLTLGLSEMLAPLDALPIHGCGLSVAQVVDFCTRCRSWGFDIHLQLGSKNYDPHDQSWGGYWRDRLTPILSALTAAGAVQHVSFWETNLWNNPALLQEILRGVSALTKPCGVYQWYHGGPGNTWWGVGGTVDNRFTWWDGLTGVLDGLLYQINPAWNSGDRQARIQDTTTKDANFMAGVFTFVAWEIDASLQFDGDTPTPAQGAADAYILLCTPGGCPVNGASGVWLPDGTPTLKG